MPVQILSLLVSTLFILYPYAYGQELRDSYRKKEDRQRQAEVCVRHYFSSHLSKYNRIYTLFRINTRFVLPDIGRFDDSEVNYPYLILTNQVGYLTYAEYANDKCVIETKKAFDVGKTYISQYYYQGGQVEFHEEESNGETMLCLYSTEGEHSAPQKECNNNNAYSVHRQKSIWHVKIRTH